MEQQIGLLDNDFFSCKHGNICSFITSIHHNTRVFFMKILRMNFMSLPASVRIYTPWQSLRPPDYPRSLNTYLIHQIISDFARRRQSLKSKCS